MVDSFDGEGVDREAFDGDGPLPRDHEPENGGEDEPGEESEDDPRDENPVHEEVMAATAAALGERGFADLTMRSVAERTDVSKSTLHYRYDTKEGLVTAWLEDYAAGNDRLLAEVEDMDPLDRLVAILDLGLAAIADPVEEGVIEGYIEIHARAARNERYREAIAEGEDALRSALAGAIAEGIESGVFRPVDPDATATLLIATLDSAGLTRHTLDDEDVIARLRTALDEVVFGSLIAEDADVDGGDLL